VKLIAVARHERLPQVPTCDRGRNHSGFGRARLASAGGGRSARRPPIVSKISVDLAKWSADPDFKQRLSNIGSYSRAHDARAGSRFVQKVAGHLVAGAAEDSQK